jgi:cell division protein ZapE
VPRSLHDLIPPDVPATTDWVPPPRFGRVSFGSYTPDHPSQVAGLASVRAFVEDPPTPPRWWWPRRRPPTGTGLYLDGGFGVGKTHLMAAAWHTSPLTRKVYLSFAELVAAIGVLGMQRARSELGQEELYCIDEFELDDPGNTLIVKTFLAHLFARGAGVITTSNTAPHAQGEGRFDAASFKREIQSVAAHFRVIAIDGRDHRTTVERSRPATAGPTPERHLPADAVVCDWPALQRALIRIHPVRYGAWVRQGRLWVVEGVTTIPDQQSALRLVHLIDKLYDQAVPLWMPGVAVERLFDASYAFGAYAKKHDRARSRLLELEAEALQLL